MKTVLITGANSGIGYSTVKLFLDNGYKVFAHYNKNKINLQLINDINLSLIQANFYDIKEVEVLFTNILKKTEKIDVLVNNAGIYRSVENFESLNIEMFDEAINVNLKAPFILSKMYIEVMKKYNHGRIINISSIGVKYAGSPTSMPYSLSKAALETMTMSFAKEGAKYNILINALRVGVTNTDIHIGAKNKNIKKRTEMIPLKRMAEPEEIAEYIFFLSSDRSRFTTGSILTIAGGE